MDDEREGGGNVMENDIGKETSTNKLNKETNINYEGGNQKIVTSIEQSSRHRGRKTETVRQRKELKSRKIAQSLMYVDTMQWEYACLADHIGDSVDFSTAENVSVCLRKANAALRKVQIPPPTNVQINTRENTLP